MSTDWDVIIVGAGPAGATLGLQLGGAGIRTLILEKEELPRYKTCGGALNIRAANSLGFDVDSVIEDTIYAVRITLRMGGEFIRSYKDPITYTVSRERLDYLLLQRATDSGATVRDGERVKHVEVREDRVIVYGVNETYVGGVVVGADGANSIVARSIGLMGDAFMDIGIESEVEVGTVDLEYWKGSVLLDLASIRYGYGWIFPKLHHLSIGVGGPQAQSKALGAYFSAFTDKYRGLLSQYRIIRKRGHRLPIRKEGAKIQSHRILLTGDAAGLIDPFNGEGIYYAIRSAQLAADVLQAYLANPDVAPLADYEALVDQALMPELQRSKAFMRLFNLYPRVFVGALRGSDRVWRAACELLRGEKTYVEIGEKLGPFEFVLDKLNW